jgi:CDGSH-type Zn-finger protein
MVGHSLLYTGFVVFRELLCPCGHSNSELLCPCGLSNSKITPAFNANNFGYVTALYGLCRIARVALPNAGIVTLSFLAQCGHSNSKITHAFNANNVGNATALY